MSSSQKDLFRLARQAGIYTSIPLLLGGGPLLGFIAGRALDSRIGTEPWGVAVGVLIGLVAGGVEAVRLIQYAQREFGSD
ncbi:MAG: hypothetical protein COV76_01940 [Candidatus Omnitrophica bacterium CG11_big_fil_rev_8_21_14_0_20_64_10]|nr:MAG: hypothetical protein COV76_01940 [Candidatus Omnitrophica bacterium CG11_big_fil_rev_8_21_14_0_20_64_10]